MTLPKLATLIAVICVLWLAACNRYSGHNGYFIFWVDFDRAAIPRCDFDTDGDVTHAEQAEYRRRWAVCEGLTIHRSELYTKDGTRLSPEEAAKRAGLVHENNQ